MRILTRRNDENEVKLRQNEKTIFENEGVINASKNEVNELEIMLQKVINN